MIKYFCDVCEKEATNPVNERDKNSLLVNFKDIDKFFHFEKMHLCQNCYDNLKSILDEIQSLKMKKTLEYLDSLDSGIRGIGIEI